MAIAERKLEDNSSFDGIRTCVFQILVLLTELRSHTSGVGDIVEGSSFPRGNLIQFVMK